MKLDHGDSRWAPVGHIPRTDDTMDTVAWRFLASEFAGRNFRNWPIDRRLDAYLRHHGLMQIVAAQTVYDALLERVIDNIGPALRKGVLAPTIR